MRTILALLVFALALWRAALDWASTGANGEAWRFVDTGSAWAARFPGGFETFRTLVTGYGGPAVWGVVERGLSLPLVSVLCFLGAFLWMVRIRGAGPKASVFKR